MRMVDEEGPTPKVVVVLKKIERRYVVRYSQDLEVPSVSPLSLWHWSLTSLCTTPHLGATPAALAASSPTRMTTLWLWSEARGENTGKGGKDIELNWKNWDITMLSSEKGI